jgi:PAS domain-containing protein
MKLKIKNINTRFYLQVIMYLLLGLIIISLSAYFARRLYSLTHINDVPVEIRQQVTSLKAIQQTFILDVKTNDNFILNRESSYNEQFNMVVSDIQQNLDHLKEFKSVRKNKEILHLSDSLSEACLQFKSTFNDLLLELQKRGIATSGLIQKILETSQTVLDGSSELKNTPVYEILLNLKRKEYEYLYTLNADNLNDITYLVEDYKMRLTELDPDVIFIPDFSMELDNYIEKIKLLKSIDSRIGLYSDETGLLKDLNTQYTSLADIVNKLEHDVKAQESKRSKINLILFISFASIGFLLIAFLSLLLGSTLNKPLKRFKQLTEELLSGRLTNNTLDESDRYEFKSINHNLNHIVNSLKAKQQFVDELLHDNMEAELELAGRHDEFGKLIIELKKKMIEVRDEQAKYNAENEIRRYINEGLAKFGEILRTNSGNLEKLSDAFIRELVKYMESVQGGLFLLDNENENTLTLKAAFAYNRKKYITKTLKLGEGLVGTCAAEQKMIHLNEIPEDYVFITSGLGDAPPRNILIIPVMYEKNLVGVFELASLKPYSENQIDLAEKIAESLASTILAARTNAQTSELLKKSQQQAAEMTEQEEEMRQNMEELKATQEESARREEELEGLLTAINSTFYVAEYDLQGNILRMNENLLLRINKSIEQVTGNFHTTAFNSVDPDLINLDLFSLIGSGETKQVIEDIKVNGKIRKMPHNFSPVKSKNGEIVKIINISSDITKQVIASK